MVVKPYYQLYKSMIQFENGVILYGGKATTLEMLLPLMFENGVILYGGKAINRITTDEVEFENGVILYGGKAHMRFVAETSGV